MRDEGDDTTPALRPQVANDANRGLVMVLGHHALVLEETRTRITELRDRIAGSPAPVAGAELVEIGRAFRREGDSAADVARVAEAAILSGGGR